MKNIKDQQICRITFHKVSNDTFLANYKAKKYTEKITFIFGKSSLHYLKRRLKCRIINIISLYVVNIDAL